MPLMDLFFDQVFVDFLQLRAKLLDPPGSSLDPSYLLYKFFVENFMKPKSDAAKDKLLNDFNSSTVPWGPANFPPSEPAVSRQLHYWKYQWLEDKEKKSKVGKVAEVVEDPAQSLPPTERESDWAILNREMSRHPHPDRYWYWEWLDQQEKEKERCAAQGKVYVDPGTQRRLEREMVIEPDRGELQLRKDDTLIRLPRYRRPSNPIYKRARARYYQKHPEMAGFQYLTSAERKERGFEYIPLAERKKRGLVDDKGRLILNFNGLISSQSVKEEEVVEMSLAQGEEEEDVEEEEIAEEEVDEEWPPIQEENIEEEDDVKEEEEDDEWPSIEEEEYVEEEDDEWPSIEEEEYVDEADDEWPSIQKEEYAEEELVRSAQKVQTQEDKDVKPPFDEEENAEEAVQRPLVQEEEENFEEDDVGKGKDKRRWWRPSWVLNKSLLVLALLILALFCGLWIYSSSSVTYQNDGAGLSLKIRMTLPHPSRFRVDKLISRVASISIHMLTQSIRLPYRFMYMADCNCDGWLTPT